MSEQAYLILEDGTIFEGKFFGTKGQVTGEIVFTTGMTGYLETLTDQSYYGQIILQTFPLMGNYGVIPEDFESSSIGVKAYIAKHPCFTPSNFRSQGDLDSFLKKHGVIGLYDIDTRSLTKIIREKGSIKGKITSSKPTDADRNEAKNHAIANPIAAVSQRTVTKEGAGKRRVALLDFGVKRGMVKALMERDCEVWTFPHDTSAEEIIKSKPNGIVLSSGPGDPMDPGNNAVIDTIKALIKSGVPIFGICIGHQLLALANGHKIKKMKFGHRGANQPVKDTKTERVYITSQGHGYEVIAEGGKHSCSFVNVNDGSCEGIDYGLSFSVQFYPEACAGPLDTTFLFDTFIERMDSHAS